MHFPHSFTEAVHALGPLAIFLGAGFEGQTAVVAGGALAQRGVLSAPVVLAMAAAGSAVVDQGLFLIGRYGRGHSLVARAERHPAFGRATRFIEGHPIAFILAFRFLYGLRAVSPVAVGLSRVGAGRFTVLNLIAAVLWAALFVFLGYAFGRGVEAMLARFRSLEVLISIGVAVVALAVAAILLTRRRRKAPAAGAGGV